MLLYSMIETTMRHHHAFTWKQYCGIVNDVLYCCSDRRLAVRILQYLRTAGIPVYVQFADSKWSY